MNVKDHDQARWSEIRLHVQRHRDGTAEWAILHHQVRGTAVWDRRLLWGRIDVPPGSLESASLLRALSVCVEHAERVSEGREGQNLLIPPAASAPPRGPQGDTPPGSRQPQ